MANIVLQSRRRIAVLAVGGALLFGGLRLLSARTYSASADFVPQSRRGPSNLSALAVQFGLAVPQGDAAQSPAFYAELVRGRTVLSAVAVDTFEWEADTGRIRTTLPSLWRLRGPPARRLDEAIRRLRGAVRVSVNQRTGVVGLTVQTPAAELSRLIAERILAEVNAFNLETRQSQAAAERRFAEQRTLEVLEELRRSEDRLQAFLLRNRDFRNSPILTFDHDRLAREVALRQQIHSTLAQALEQAKIDEVRDTPVITVLESAVVPVRPDRRGAVNGAFIGVVLGGLLGLSWAFGAAMLRRTKVERRSEYEEFQTLRAELAADLRHPLRAFGRNAVIRGETAES